DAVFQAEAQRKTRRRLVISLSLVLVIVAAGFGAVHLVGYMKEPLSVSGGLKSPAPALHPAPPASVALPPSPQAEGSQPVSESRDMRASLTETPVAEKPEVREKGGKTKYGKKRVSKHTAALGETRREKAAKTVKAELMDYPTGVYKPEKEAYLYAARTHEMQGNYRQALSYYKKVLAIEPANFVILNNISSAFIHMGKYHDSIQYARKAVALKRDYVPALVNMGIAYSQMGKHRESEANLQRAFSIDPSNRFVLLNLGILYEKKEDFDRAQEYFLILTGQGDPQGYLGLARIAERQGRIADAVNYYRLASSMEGADLQVRTFVKGRLGQLVR
ncbi:MAG: tetratricopeptide repeat protein, partial [Deltaproteobacteria bacterium]|nr:tetratricopeptide repeat protein [Deltaproteobacteria bacterium]